MKKKSDVQIAKAKTKMFNKKWSAAKKRMRAAAKHGTSSQYARQESAAENWEKKHAESVEVLRCTREANPRNIRTVVNYTTIAAGVVLMGIGYMILTGKNPEEAMETATDNL